jgi:hypothetical protein
MDDRLSEEEDDPIYQIQLSQPRQTARRNQAWGQQRYEDLEEAEEDKVEIFEANRRRNIATINNYADPQTQNIDVQLSSSIGRGQNGIFML